MWKSIFKELPINDQRCWIRVLTVFGQLTVASWNERDQTFITLDSEIIIPAYMVGRWKADV